MYTYRQLQRDPVLRCPYTQFGDLLNPDKIVDSGTRIPLPNEVNQPKRSCDRRKAVKSENWQVLVLLLPQNYRPNVEGDQDDQQGVREYQQVDGDKVSDESGSWPVEQNQHSIKVPW